MGLVLQGRNQVRPPQDRTELFPELFLQAADRHIPSIFRFVHIVIGKTAAQPVVATHIDEAVPEIGSTHAGHQGEADVEEVELDLLPCPGLPCVVQGGQNGHAGHGRRLHVGYEGTGNGRRSVFLAAHGDQARQTLIPDVMIRPVRKGARLTEPGNGTVHNFRVDPARGFEVDAQFLQDAGPEAFDDDIRRLH